MNLAKPPRGFSLRLCAFARQKISGSRQGAKGLSNFFAPFLLCENKKRMNSRKDAKPQRGFFFAPLRLCAPNKKIL